MPFRFRAFLRGSEEVPPVRTNATGTTSFRLSQNGQRLDFRLVVKNLRNFTEAHIHVGARGVNGPVVVFLFGPVTRGISVNRGVVAGSITQADLVGPLQGRPLSELIRLMKNGQTYVNVHTTQNPDGEIRGQIRRALRRNKR
ncbi:CHRD domain-containing protein [Brevibacillus formosus]|uniref:CHRD domain-containing protein n=1 Tax=Brevibacillus formosus TaxID=54913 RepID=UPI001C668804|nr:CHRD domain-containing protein [Brevibacillus formosus]MBW5471523.1 CHRD domain-containing protein [Brevibacillus formosus]